MVDYRSLVERADLYYCGLTPQHYQGMPVGNGVTGSMVWVQSGTIGMQVNRVDVFATNSATEAANWDMDAPDYMGVHEYCGGCAGVSLDFQEDIFNNTTKQILHMYDGALQILGKEVSAELIVWSDTDAFVYKVTDRRLLKTQTRITLKMLRPAYVRRMGHLAESAVKCGLGRICLIQEFSEKCSTGISENDHYCASCVVAGVKGAGIRNMTLDMESHVTMWVQPEKEEYYIIIASGSDFCSVEDAIDKADFSYERARAACWNEIWKTHTQWWNDFWAKSFLYTPDHPEFSKAWYTYLYYVGSTMRGNYPAKFNGLLFSADGDTRFWGGQYWWFNQSRSHYGLSAANHGDCNRPLFGMLLRNLPRYRAACDQQFGGKGGIYLPETDAFSGPELLPDEIAGDLKNSLLFDVPATDRLLRFMEKRSGLNSRWACFYSGEQLRKRDIQDFRWHSNLSYDAGDAANSMLEYYHYMDDMEILREIYPWLKGVAEFYRHHPCGHMEEDGCYHIDHLGWAESITWAEDIIDDITVMKGIYPTVIAVSEKLGVDHALRQEWERMITVLPPYPVSDMEDAIACKRSHDGLTTYAIGRRPCNMMMEGNPNDCRLRMTFSFDLMNLETRKERGEEWQIANRTLDALPVVRLLKQGIPALNGDAFGYAFNRVLVKAAMLGRTDLIRECLPAVLRAFHVAAPCPGGERYFPNRLPLTNGREGYSIQELGAFSDQLQAPLLQCLANGPGHFEHVIHIVPAWPMEWDVSFELRAKGAFLVAAQVKEKRLAYVRILSEKGNKCMVHNPWPGEMVCVLGQENKAVCDPGGEGNEIVCTQREEGNEVVSGQGKKENIAVLQGDTLVFDTVPGWSYRLYRKAGSRVRSMPESGVEGKTESNSESGVDGKTESNSGSGVESEYDFHVKAPCRIVLDMLAVDRDLEDEIPFILYGKRTTLKMSDDSEAAFTSSCPEIIIMDGADAYGKRTGSCVITAWKNGVAVDSRRINVIYPVVNDDDQAICYTGCWERKNLQFDGSYRNSYHLTCQKGAAASVTFTGSGFELYSPCAPGYGGLRILVDGVEDRIVSCQAGERLSGHLLCAKRLSYGVHTLRMEACQAEPAGLDYIRILTENAEN